MTCTEMVEALEHVIGELNYQMRQPYPSGYDWTREIAMLEEVCLILRQGQRKDLTSVAQR